MHSRLDRLFILLDTGSNESIRLAAAKQLGEVQRVQPNDLSYILRRIKDYSSKTIWETRVAAGQAIGCVLKQVEQFPNSRTGKQESDRDDKSSSQQQIAAHELITSRADLQSAIQNYDLRTIISSCPSLLSVSSIDTDESDVSGPSNSRGTSRGSARKNSTRGTSKKEARETLLRQRRLINKELGISMMDGLGVKSTDIVSNDDLQMEYSDTSESPNKNAQFSPNTQDTYSTLRRYFTNYDRIIEELKKSRLIDKSKSTTKSDDLGEQYDSNDWPLSSITREYITDLFNPAWEVRHGAAIALREIIRLQGQSAGKRSDLCKDSNYKLNQIWLIDVSLVALSVLALDKFGDFLFDQVVAPVRENVAQLLGCCVAVMSESNAHSIVRLLTKMLGDTSWEVRHGGILGLKYSLNVVEGALSRRLLLEFFDSIFKLLDDNVDDVSAEAAAALVPVKDVLIETIPEKSPQLIKFLWEHLADLDELTTSTSNIVLLLASLINSSSADLESSELIRSVPRLWPLLGHPSTSVRVSVLKALITLIKTQNNNCLTWMPEHLISIALRLIFQRSILENIEEVRPYIVDVWMLLIKVDQDPIKAQTDKFNLLRYTSQYLNYWLCLTMQPFNGPIDRANPLWLNIKADGTPNSEKPDGELYIGSSTFDAETLSSQKTQVTKCRLLGSKMIGALYARLVCDANESQHSSETLRYLSDMFNHYLRTKSANQRIYSGWGLESWALQQTQLCYEEVQNILLQNLETQLNQALQEISLCYDELAPNFTRLQQETREFVTYLMKANINLENMPATNDRRTIYNLNQIQRLCDLNIESELLRLVSKKRGETDHDVTKHETFSNLVARKSSLSRTFKSTTQSQRNLSTSVLSSLACAYISWRMVPEKMSLIVNPLLDSIDREEDVLLQDKSIEYLKLLLEDLCRDQAKHSTLIEDTLNRLINVLVNRELATCTQGSLPLSPVDETGGEFHSYSDHRIILLDNLLRKAEQNRLAVRRQSSVSASNQSLKRSLSASSNAEFDSEKSDVTNSPFASLTIHSETISKGASNALCSITKHFGKELPTKLPSFWQSISSKIASQIEAHLKVISNGLMRNTQEEVSFTRNLLLLETVGESIDETLRHEILTLFNQLIRLLPYPSSMIRHRISQCIGIISKLMFNETIESISKSILPMLNEPDHILARCGSIEAIASIIEHLQLELVPRIDLFIVHVLRRMSDQNEQVRLLATHCFGKLLGLMPLNLEGSRIMKLPSASESNQIKETFATNEQQREEQRFIEQLLNPKKLDDFAVPFKMNASLRSYQQDGLNWLSFLTKFNLHGILCDEMGLGKTFMTICMVTSNHYLNAQYSSEDSVDRKSRYQPSLIVCPSTLTEHWLYEITKFVPTDMRSILNPVTYTGSQSERTSLRAQISRSLNDEHEIERAKVRKQTSDVNLVISSYDIVRNDIDFFRSINWNYCVLDEGHIIKNGKTKLSKAIRLLRANHRLILSGTPIQNNVTELWSLFDFLMPGFLGSEKQFNNRFAKPILQSREPKCSPRELEAGALAMESLHKQVLPFILRRLKEDVLDDLPPKIIQDYYCELSPLQHKLYEDFTRSKLCKDVTKKSLGLLVEDDQGESGESSQSNDLKTNSKSHVFQALQYLKNVCNHPKLVLTPKHSQYMEIKRGLDAEKSTLDDINHSSKLKALKQLLIDCGIGAASQPVSGEEQQQVQSLSLESVVNQHRALIFCQVRSMVNIIENDLIKKHLPSITYLKLDGSIPAKDRQSIVSRFNDDPSIDILLLTTQIGGLGLNLTGADTVIFVEHDWNPTKDLQAMDRAHRIGQKKVVNVYRLITKSTLEEKIMGLQKFKTMVSNTVINQDNTGLSTMNVDQLFDLFDEKSQQNVDGSRGSSMTTSGVGEKGSTSFIDLLPELWDQQQYENEYDLSHFVSSLKG